MGGAGGAAGDELWARSRGRGWGSCAAGGINKIIFSVGSIPNSSNEHIFMV